MSNDFTRENGKEVLWYAENAVGRIIHPVSPMSDLPPGYALRSTKSPKEMDRVFARMHDQEREANEKRIEQLWGRGRENFEEMRSRLRARLSSSSATNLEKSIVRAALSLMDQKQHDAEQNTVYGVSAMQEAPEPLPARNTRVM